MVKKISLLLAFALVGCIDVPDVDGVKQEILTEIEGLHSDIDADVEELRDILMQDQCLYEVSESQLLFFCNGESSFVLACVLDESGIYLCN